MKKGFSYRVLLLLCAAVMTLASCGKISEIRPTSFELESLSPKGLYSLGLDFKLGIHNPAMQIALSDIFAEVMLDGKVVGNLSLAPFVMEAKSDKTYDMNALVALNKGFSIINLLPMMKDPESLKNAYVNVKVKATLKNGLSKNLEWKEIPVGKTIETCGVMKTNILKYLLIVIMAFVSVMSMSAQTPTEPVYTHPADTIVYEAPPLVDTTLVGTDIFDVLHVKKSNGKATVALHQSKAIEESVRTHIIANKGRTLNGYRIRIFFDNSQDARVNSGGAYGTFLKIFKGIPAYRSYVNPYFKVSVGDFRTKAEAMEKLIHIKRVFPAAFIVKEKIRFPHVDRAVLDDLPDSLEVFKL